MSRLSLDNPKACIAAVKYFKRADTLRVVAILILKAAAPETSLKSAIKDERKDLLVHHLSEFECYALSVPRIRYQAPASC